MPNILPEPLRYDELLTARKTAMDSRNSKGSNDPLWRYLQIFEPRSSLSVALARLNFAASWANDIRKGLAWTIDHGQAILTFAPPAASKPRTPVDAIVNIVLTCIAFLARFVRTKEQNKRVKEALNKYEKAVESALGNRRRDMFEVVHLATAPVSQGHGYATKLVRMVTAMADKEGRATWLASSNVADNTGYYNYLGFITVKEFTLGEENPTWKEPPVIIAIMIREPGLEAKDAKVPVI